MEALKLLISLPTIIIVSITIVRFIAKEGARTSLQQIAFASTTKKCSASSNITFRISKSDSELEICNLLSPLSITCRFIKSQ